MPAKNILKEYVKDGYYHVYNRGVEKRVIFQDDQDHKVFLNYLKEYLEPPPPLETLIREFEVDDRVYKGIDKPINNYYGKIELIAYCLMANHFHLLLKQNEERSLEFFMRSLGTRYTLYFNKRNNRVGHFFQGTYKAVYFDSEGQLLHLSRYIHLNPVKETPLEVSWKSKLRESYSSYQEFLGKRKTKWLKPDVVLSSFPRYKPKGTSGYQSFVEDYYQEEADFTPNLLIDYLSR